MQNNTHYDIFIVGGGQAGIPLAFELAKSGRKVALAERKDVGGSCVNFGCTPSKAALASARVASLAKRGGEFGIKIPAIEIDFPAVLKRAREISAQSRNSLEQSLEKNSNPMLLNGHAHLEGRSDEYFKLRVGDKLITAQEVVLNTGTRSAIPPIEGIEKVDYITADNWLDKKDLPKHLVMVGGSYVGLEMAQFYRRMGSKVTVIEQSGQIAGNEDRPVADELQKLLENEGIAFRLNAEVKSVQPKNGALKLQIAEIGTSEMAASHIFIATGRKPNTDDLGLDKIGVETDNQGFVKTDEHLKTSVNHVWAAGDIRGGPMFTHTSYHDYRVIASDITGLGSRTRGKYVPYAVFTDPELGRAGMTEKQARDAGYSFEVARFEMNKNGKAREMGENKGFIKVMINTKNNQMIGAAVLAAEGAELVHLYADLMNAEAPYTVIRDAIYIHPTLAEALQSAVSSLS